MTLLDFEPPKDILTRKLSFEPSPEKDSKIKTRNISNIFSDTLDENKLSSWNDKFSDSEYLEFLSTSLQILASKGVASSVLKHIKAELTLMLYSGRYWSVKFTEKTTLRRFLNLFYSLPEKITAIFELTDEDVFIRRKFVKILTQQMSLEVEPALLLATIPKVLSLGSLDILTDSLVANESSFIQIIQFCIDNCELIYFESFITELTTSIHSRFCDNVIKMNFLISKLRFNRLFSDNVQLLCGNIPFEVAALIIGSLFQGIEDLAVIENSIRHFVENWSLRIDLKSLIHQQRHSTRLLLAILSLTNQQTIAKLNLEITLFEGIGRRINSAYNEILLMGQIAGECFALSSPNETRLLFDLDSEQALYFRRAFQYLDHVKQAISEDMGLSFVECQFSWKVPPSVTESIPEYANIEPTAPSVPSLPSPKLSPIINITEKDELVRNAKVKPPRFLRDCLVFLKTPNDRDRIELALNHFANIFTSSSNILKDEISSDIFKCALYLGDTFNIEKFDLLRHELLTSICFEVPHVVGKLIVSEIVGRSITIAQKVDLLYISMRSLRQDQLPTQSKSTRDSIIAKKLRMLDQAMGFEGNSCKSLVGNMTVQRKKIVSNVTLPLLSILPDCNNRLFIGNTNRLLLEKFIYFGAVSLESIRNTELFIQAAPKLITFILSLIKANILDRPILKAIILTNHSIFINWPTTLPILPYAESVAQIIKYFDIHSEIVMDLEDDFVRLAAYSLEVMENRLLPENLLQEAASLCKLDS